jgi:hypothetical protein
MSGRGVAGGRGREQYHVHVDLASVVVVGLLPGNAHWEFGVSLERGLIWPSLAPRASSRSRSAPSSVSS